MAEVVKNKFVSARTKLLRRTSGFSEASSTASTSPENEQPHSPHSPHSPPGARRKSSFVIFGRSATRPKRDASRPSIAPATETASGPPPTEESTPQRPPTLTVQAPSSPELKASQKLLNGRPLSSNNQLESEEHPDPGPTNSSAPSSRATSTRPPLTRTSTRGSYIGVPSALNANNSQPSNRESEHQDQFVDALAIQIQPQQAPATRGPKMSSTPQSKRKVWVRRPNASATQVPFSDDDLVDDVRDTILTKYRNSLGKAFDSPDVALRIQPRERSSHGGHERTLGPEESVASILEACFPGGQDVSEALVIDVPQRRTPRASPRIIARPTDYYEDTRPTEDSGGYFPPMSANNSGGQLTPQERRGAGTTHHPHAIAILETGQAPALPSPRDRRSRPKPSRQHTSSPTIVSSAGTSGSANASYTNMPHAHGHTPKSNRNRRDSNDRVVKAANHAPNPPPIPRSPSPEVIANGLLTSTHKVSTPPAGASHPASPRLGGPAATSKPKRSRKSAANGHHDPLVENPGMQGIESATSVPPINVLIVEDNIINLRLMEQFVGKLKVRWGTAMNGRDAVARWREGGYHLVLMDLQMPIMNGLDATKEIRRLERVNGIGVFARGDESVEADAGRWNGINGITEGFALARRASKDATEEDKLGKGVFKCPVIIVALTASNLQSDRREALAAGCNDFLTKPVNLRSFERKVMEWGCMQALIDFSGWRQWKELGEREELEKQAKQSEETPEQRKKREKKEAKRMEVLKKIGQR